MGRPGHSMWVTRALVLLVVVSGTLRAAPSHAQPASTLPEEPDARTQRELDRAERLLDAGRTPSARSRLRQSLRRAPSLRGVTLALRLLPALPDAASPSPDALADANWILEVLDSLEHESDTLERARGSVLALLGRHREAIDAVHARAQNAASAATLHAMAALFAARDALMDAERAMRRALRILPQSRDLRVALAALHVARGRPEHAVQTLMGVLGLFPNDHEARRDLAGALMAAGRHEEAIATLEHLERVSEDPADSILLADAALELGRHHVAERAARRAIDAGEASGLATLALTLAAQGRRTEALQALARAPDDVRARRARRVLGENAP